MIASSLVPVAVRRPLLSLSVFALALASLCTAQSAAAANANWRLLVRPAPKNITPGGSGQFLIRVENIGDAATNGAPVVVVDHLPAGLVATAAGALEPDESSLFGEGPWGEGPGKGEHCAGVGTSTIMCTYDQELAEGDEPIRPVTFESAGPTGFGTAGQPLTIGINVQAEPAAAGETLTDEATISGGGATRSASATATTTISNETAPFGLENVHEWVTNADGTPDAQAGSHPYEMATSVMVNVGAALGGNAPSGEEKDLHVVLPAGFAGAVDATPRCTRAEFDERIGTGGLLPGCPADTQVGIVVAYTAPNFPVTIGLYNIVPPAGIPAQFAFAFNNKFGFLNVGVATGGGYNVTIEVPDLPQTLTTGAIVSVWGDPADRSHDRERFRPKNGETAGSHGESIRFEAPPRPLLSLPPSCGMESLSVAANSWEEPVELSSVKPVTFLSSDESEQPVSLEGCQSLSFNPGLEVTPETTGPDSPSGLGVNLTFPQQETVSGNTESDLKQAVIQLPAGLSISPSAANGLQACQDTPGVQPTPGNNQIGLKFNGPGSCLPESKIGTVKVTTPLLETPLEGAMFIAQPSCGGSGQPACTTASATNGELYGLFIEVAGSGVVVKLAGEVKADPATGQLTATFRENPQLPFNRFEAHLFGGSKAPLVSPPTCGSYTAAAQETSWSSSAPVSLEAQPFSLPGGCAVGGFSPSSTAGTVNNQAGAFSPFTLSFSRQDGEQRFSGASFTLPPGVLAKLAGVPLCPEAAANVGSCPASSQVGTVTAAAGPGSSPLYVSGGEYLTGPYEGGAYGLVDEVPAVAGPFNLGTVVVRQSLHIDPHTAQVTVVSDPFPTILDGTPLDIRSINADTDRAGFTLNATNCSPLSVAGTLTSTENASAAVSSPYEAANCATLPFRPIVTAETEAKTTKADGAYLHFRLTAPAGQANIGKTKVDLPVQLPSRLTTLQKACLAATFEANPASCPAASMIGTATAVTPLLAHPATGPGYLVSYGGAAFPDLVFVLQDEGVTIDLVGNTDIKKHVTSESFETLPDVPVSSFDAVFPTGPTSILGANLPNKAHGSMCHQNLKMPIRLTGQNGIIITETIKLKVTGCPKTKTAHKSSTRK
jgi:uncharacterized repeat protein (TIGR01451 family)